MKIKITVNSHMHELTVEEARRVYDELDSIFGTLGGKRGWMPGDNGFAPMYPGFWGTACDPVQYHNNPTLICKAH